MNETEPISDLPPYTLNGQPVKYAFEIESIIGEHEDGSISILPKGRSNGEIILTAQTVNDYHPKVGDLVAFEDEKVVVYDPLMAAEVGYAAA